MPVIRITDGQPMDLHLFKNGLPDTSTPAVNVVGQQVVIKALTATSLAPNNTAGNMSDADRLNQYLRVQFLHLAANSPAASWPVDCTFSLAPNDDFVYITFRVRPNSPIDEYYCRIVADDGTQRKYNVLFRISVHQELREFHLGTSQLTLINSHGRVPLFEDIKKIRVYGQCGNGPGLLDTVADLTGHSYIIYTPVGVPTGITRVGHQVSADIPTITSANTPVAAGAFTINIGATQPASLPHQVNLFVVGRDAGTRRVLRRVHTGNLADATRKLKLLIVTEGFTQQAEVDQWLTFIQRQLLNNPLHEPFNLLGNSLDIWTADLRSYDARAGITLQSPVTTDGWLVPTFPIQYYGTPGHSVDQGRVVTIGSNRVPLYTVQDLIKLVGLPPVIRPFPSMADAVREWTNPPSPRTSIPTFNQQRLDAVVYEAWAMLRPATFIYAKDTVFNVMKGTDAHQRGSFTPLTKGDWALDIAPSIPHVDKINADAYPDHERMADILRTLRTSTTAVAAGDPDLQGSHWVYDSNDATSARMVCLLVKDPLTGGGSFSVPGDGGFYSTFFSAGAHKKYPLVAPLTATSPVTDIAFPIVALTPPPVTTPVITPDTFNAVALAGVATLIHEIGHLLGLGDEYGNMYGKHASGPLPQVTPTMPQADIDEANDERAKVDKYVNITSVNQLQPLGTIAVNIAATPPATGILAHPEFIKWNWDRVTRSSMLLTTPVVVTPAPATPTIRVRVDADGQNWKSQIGTTALLRKRELLPENRNSQTVYPMKITNATQVAATTTPPIVPGYYVLELEGSVNGLAKGDVIYVPLTDAANLPMRLIAAEVERELTVQFCSAPSASCTVASQAKMVPSAAVVAAMNAALKARTPAGATIPTVTNDHRIIAVYEGGGEYDCLVYRSNGVSKMRFDAEQTDLYGTIGGISIPQNPGGAPPDQTTVTPFNYVSQYHLVNKINPTLLAALDTTYDNLTH